MTPYKHYRAAQNKFEINKKKTIHPVVNTGLNNQQFHLFPLKKKRYINHRPRHN